MLMVWLSQGFRKGLFIVEKRYESRSVSYEDLSRVSDYVFAMEDPTSYG